MRSVGFVLLCTAAACKSDSPTGPDEAVPIYGACDVQPTYVGEVNLNRWRSFPLTYFFDDASFPAEFLVDYRAAITDGIRRWDEATSNELGAVEEVGDREAADFVILYLEFPVPAAARVIHSAGTPFLAGGQIQFNPIGMRVGEDFVREGTISRETFHRGISSMRRTRWGICSGS
jgi:hypothetical protein